MMLCAGFFRLHALGGTRLSGPLRQVGLSIQFPRAR